VTPDEWNMDKIRRRRKEEEHRILDRMIRKRSGLPANVIEELEGWEQLFHEEVHGSRLSFVSEMKDLVRQGTVPSIGPTPNESSMVMYMNRACEIAWLMVRLMPYLQPTEDAFGGRWRTQYQILDDSFLYMQRALSKIGKKIGDAFIIFVDQKFSFRQPLFYLEADGSA